MLLGRCICNSDPVAQCHQYRCSFKNYIVHENVTYAAYGGTFSNSKPDETMQIMLIFCVQLELVPSHWLAGCLSYRVSRFAAGAMEWCISTYIYHTLVEFGRVWAQSQPKNKRQCGQNRQKKIGRRSIRFYSALFWKYSKTPNKYAWGFGVHDMHSIVSYIHQTEEGNILGGGTKHDRYSVSSIVAM